MAAFVTFDKICKQVLLCMQGLGRKTSNDKQVIFSTLFFPIFNDRHKGNVISYYSKQSL